MRAPIDGELNTAEGQGRSTRAMMSARKRKVIMSWSHELAKHMKPNLGVDRKGRVFVKSKTVAFVTRSLASIFALLATAVIVSSALRENARWEEVAQNVVTWAVLFVLTGPNLLSKLTGGVGELGPAWVGRKFPHDMDDLLLVLGIGMSKSELGCLMSCVVDESYIWQRVNSCISPGAAKGKLRLREGFRPGIVLAAGLELAGKRIFDYYKSGGHVALVERRGPRMHIEWRRYWPTDGSMEKDIQMDGQIAASKDGP